MTFWIARTTKARSRHNRFLSAFIHSFIHYAQNKSHDQILRRRNIRIRISNTSCLLFDFIANIPQSISCTFMSRGSMLPTLCLTSDCENYTEQKEFHRACVFSSSTMLAARMGELCLRRLPMNCALQLFPICTKTTITVLKEQAKAFGFVQDGCTRSGEKSPQAKMWKKGELVRR